MDFVILFLNENQSLAVGGLLVVALFLSYRGMKNVHCIDRMFVIACETVPAVIIWTLAYFFPGYSTVITVFGLAAIAVIYIYLKIEIAIGQEVIADLERTCPGIFDPYKPPTARAKPIAYAHGEEITLSEERDGVRRTARLRKVTVPRWEDRLQ